MSDEINNTIKNPNSDLLSVANDVGILFLQPELSDLKLVVHDQKFNVHRVILAARCQYFRALLYGGLKESYEAEIELQEETSVEAVEQILKFIYKGSVNNITEMNDEMIMELLTLAHKYGLSILERQISLHLAQGLDVENVVTILNIAVLYEMKSLCDVCLRFLDKNSTEILNNQELINGFSENALIRMVSRDSFCSDELDIFSAVQGWVNLNGSVHVLNSVRLPLISLSGLLGTVRDSNLIEPNRILDAIRDQQPHHHINSTLQHRGVLLPDEDLATKERGFSVLVGKPQLDDNHNYLAIHEIANIFPCSMTTTNLDESNYIEFSLGAPSKVNLIKLQLPDVSDLVSFSYTVEVSLCRDKVWTCIADFRTYLCRSWQYIYLSSQVIQYIRIRGTRNSSGNRTFAVLNVHILFTDHVSALLSPSASIRGILAMTDNVASLQRHATVIEGVSRSRNSLLDGDTKRYDWDTGYTCHQLGNGAIVVQLSQPYLINVIRFLLWDLDDRHYGYTVEVSVDRIRWDMVSDRSGDTCSSMQTVEFPGRPVVFIRIIGTNNTANEVFHIVHLEANYKQTNDLSCIENELIKELSDNIVVMMPRDEVAEEEEEEEENFDELVTVIEQENARISDGAVESSTVINNFVF